MNSACRIAFLELQPTFLKRVLLQKIWNIRQNLIAVTLVEGDNAKLGRIPRHGSFPRWKKTSRTQKATENQILICSKKQANSLFLSRKIDTEKSI
jgi:hypothetical protein